MDHFLSFCVDQAFPETCLVCGAVLEAPEPLPALELPPGWPGDSLAFFGIDFNVDLFGVSPVSARILCPGCWLTLEPARPLERLRSACAGPEESGRPYSGRHGGEGSTEESVSFISPFFTNETLLEIVRYLKFSGGVRAAAPLSWWLASALGRWLGRKPGADDRILLTAVPLHPARRRSRGYNQAALLGAGAARRLGLPYADGVLVRRRNTRSQSKLPDSMRARNVRDAFSVGDGARAAGRDIVIVDDLVTSGETVMACVKALREAGPSSIAVCSAGRPRSFE